MIAKKFYEPIFQTTIYFATDCDQKEFNEWVSKKGVKVLETRSADGFCATFLLKDKTGLEYAVDTVYIRHRADFYTLVHESAHLTKNILDLRGIPVESGNTNEIFAYLQTYWVQKFWRVMNPEKISYTINND
jgi:hypothetical protein